METLKLCSLVLKILILTVVYSVVLMNADASHLVSEENVSQQISQTEEDSEAPESAAVKFPKTNILPLLLLPEQTILTPTPTPTPTTIPPSKEIFQTDPVFMTEVQEITNTVLKEYPLKYPLGLYVCELQTGNEYGIHENLTCYDVTDGSTDGYFRAASVVKLQMAYVAYRLIEKGELELEQSWKDSVTGKEILLQTALHKMVSQSDNNLFNTMLRFLGREKVNQTLIEFGIMNSRVYGEINPAAGYSAENNQNRHGTVKVGGKITPGDMGRILKAVYFEKDTNSCMGYFNEALLANIYDTRIPTGIGWEYPVAHKTGTAQNYGVYNDAGIIYCKNPYILVVLTKGETSARAQGFIREMAGKLTDYMDARKPEEAVSDSGTHDLSELAPKQENDSFGLL